MNSFHHLQAEQEVQQETAVSSVHTFPSPAEFKAVWADVRSGRCWKDGEKRAKSCRMEWCLAEAIREKHRRFLATAATVSMSADSRHGRLLMYFSGASQTSLEVRRGVLGVERDFGTGNEAYERAMTVVMERLCRPGVCSPKVVQKPSDSAGGCAPQIPKTRRDEVEIITKPLEGLVVHDSGGPGGTLDEKLLGHIHERTHMVVADAAGDGQHAFENLKKSGVLRNLIVRFWDQAHGARRLTSRPWAADEHMSEVVETLILGSHSLTMLLQNSPDFRSWLESNLKTAENDMVVRSDGVASGIRKHRFDSTQMPLAKAVLRHRASIMTALQIARVRKGDHPATCANYYLLFISGSEGIKRLLLLAMLADAGDESAMVLRAADKTHSDPADTAFMIESYVRRIQTLFLEGSCLRTGYTQVMMESLKKPIVYVVRGAMLQCGDSAGASRQQVTWCLEKMQCWARLAIATARAEFPEYTVLHAMSVFHLRSPDLAGNGNDHARAFGGGSAPQAGDNVTEMFKTLATAFEVSEERLVEQYFAVKPLAETTLVANSCSQREAWRSAVLRCTGVNKSTRHKVKVSELEKVVQAWLGWETGTGVIERAFSTHQQHFCSSRRGKMNRQREQDIITLTADYRENEADEIVEMATEIWKTNYRNVRRNLNAILGNKRADFGRKHKRRNDNNNKPSLSRFITKRRRAVSAHVGSTDTNVLGEQDLQAMTAHAWTPDMAKEEAHMKGKRAYRFMQMLAAGGRAPRGSLPAGYSKKQLVDIYQANEARLAADRTKKGESKRSAFTPVARRSLTGKAVMWIPGDLAVSTSVQTVADKLRIRTATTIDKADIVCVRDFGGRELTPFLKLQLYLNGGSLAQLEYITTLGKQGACITLQAAVRAHPLQVWLSTRFAERNPQKQAAIEAAIMSAGSKWTWFVGNNVEFLRKAAGAKKKLVGVVTNDEFNAFPRGLATVMTLDGFLGHIRHIDEKNTQMLG